MNALILVTHYLLVSFTHIIRAMMMAFCRTDWFILSPVKEALKVPPTWRRLSIALKTTGETIMLCSIDSGKTSCQKNWVVLLWDRFDFGSTYSRHFAFGGPETARRPKPTQLVVAAQLVSQYKAAKQQSRKATKQQNHFQTQKAHCILILQQWNHCCERNRATISKRSHYDMAREGGNGGHSGRNNGELNRCM